MTADGRFINRVTNGGDAAGGAEAPGSEPVGRGALTKQVLVEGDDFAVVDLRCRRDRDRWSTRAPIEEPAIVFVRRGCFYRRVDGVESVMDPTVVFFESPGQERMLRHPFVGGGDACTWILLSAGLLTLVWADVEIPLLAPLPTSAEIDLEHRASVARGHCWRRPPGDRRARHPLGLPCAQWGSACARVRGTTGHGCRAAKAGRCGSGGDRRRATDRPDRAGTSTRGLAASPQPSLPGRHGGDRVRVPQPDPGAPRPRTPGRGRSTARTPRGRAGLLGSRPSHPRRPP